MSGVSNLLPGIAFHRIIQTLKKIIIENQLNTQFIKEKKFLL